MDGFGLRPDAEKNAVIAASKPNLIAVQKKSPNIPISGSGRLVGLPEGQMGNSEVGHLNIGAGRVVYQDVTRIDKSIEEGEFFKNEVFLEGFRKARESGNAVHLLGLVSDGCVHSSLVHLDALTKMAADNGVEKLYLHAFMDGRDTPPRGGAGYMQTVLDSFKKHGIGKVATVGGRYYGMDRDKRWTRIEQHYQAVVNRKAEKIADPITAIKQSYDKDVTDEFIIPVVIDLKNEEEAKVKDGDVLVFFNFRADRMRQICHMLLGHPQEDYDMPDHPDIHMITMTNYSRDIPEAHVAFPPVSMKNLFGEVLANNGLKQLRIAETEKYAHVTYFFNGGNEDPFEGEDRCLISSPKVATYDLQPEMSSVEVTDETVRRILSKKYDVIVLNFANCDMVGHTGDFDAARKAVEAVDTGLGRIIEAVDKIGGQAIITADHGNAEQMYDPKSVGPHTAHTTNPVPFIFYDASGKKGKVKLRSGGKLADIAPTILEYLGIEQPDEMTGQSMFIPGEIPVKHS